MSKIFLGLIAAMVVFGQQTVIPDPFAIGTGLQFSATGAGLGSVTSVSIAGTTNQITATGTCSATTVVTCTLSIPTGFTLPGTIDGLTITTTTGTLTLANAKTLTVNNTLTITGTDASTINFPAPGAVTSGDCTGWTKSGSTLSLVDAGACALAAAWSAITAGTNTAALLMGSGGSLGTTGGGTIAATSVPAAGVVTGALSNGMTATTQSSGDNTAKLATTAFVLANGGTSLPPNCVQVTGSSPFTLTFAAGIPCNYISIAGSSTIILPSSPSYSQAELWILYTGSATTTPITLTWDCPSTACTGSLPVSPDVTTMNAVSLIEIKYNAPLTAWGGYLVSQSNGGIPLHAVVCSQGPAGPPTACATGLARRTCDIAVGDETASVIVNGQLGPQKRICFIPGAATIVEMDVAADGGTPSVIVGNNAAGTVTNIVSSALATAASGGIACSNVGGTAGIDGVTTCSGTLQNTGLATGSYLELVSGTAGGTAKLMTIHVIYTIN